MMRAIARFSGRAALFFLLTATGIGTAATAGGAADDKGASPGQCSALATTNARETIAASNEQSSTIHGQLVSLPDFCRAHGVIHPVEGSNIGFELWLPAAWNGRYQMFGNGGYSSALPLAQMAAYLRLGYAVIATDTGHAGDDPDFAIGHPEAIADWAFRAVHETAILGQKLVARHYGRPARARYFFGCSTGGQQAFSEAQRFPDDFQGIVAGAPGHDRIRLNAAFLFQYLQNHQPGDDRRTILGQQQLDLLQRASFAACRNTNGGAAGGLADDPWLDNPLLCRFDPATLQCPAGQDSGNDSSCLSPAQVKAARAMYKGAVDERGRPVAHPWLPGSEAQWSLYWANPANPAEPARVNFWRLWAFDDPHWNWWRFSFASDLPNVLKKLAATVDATSPDLGRFASAGGRMIHYHGLADPVVPPGDSIAYHRAVQEEDAKAPAGGRQTDRYYRLFLAPGVGHCAGGPGPDQLNLQQAIEAWVEHGQPPAKLVATTSAAAIAAGARKIARPLCPYPQVARYRGGPVDAESSFSCQP